MFSSAIETDVKPTQKPKPLPLIKEEEDDNNNNFFSRLLSKDDTAMANPSFRVYYGSGAVGSVPFIWESQPGTPKHYVHSLFSDQPPSSLPPLTPPPNSSFRERSNLLELRNKEEAVLPAANPSSSFFRSLLKKVSLRKTSSGPMLMPENVKSTDNDSGKRRQRFDSVFIDDDDEEDEYRGSGYFCFQLGNSKRARQHQMVAS